MWFTDNPWPPILICFALAIVLFSYGNATGRMKVVAVAVGLLISCPLIYFVEGAILTSREVIEQEIYDLAEGVGNGDTAAVLDHISESAPQYLGMVQSGMSQFKIAPDISITDVTVELSEDEQEAFAHFRANAKISKEESRSGTVQRRFPSRWEVTFQNEPDRWRIIKIKRLSPISGREMPILAPRFE